ncbi:MAG: DNA (cytosine-5-)-methyltransferase [Pseudophaeobacter sp.]
MNTRSAKILLKSLMKEHGVSTADLALLLAGDGSSETKASIDSKISRGSFSADFFLHCLNVIQVQDTKVNFSILPSDPKTVAASKLDNNDTARFRDERAGVNYIRTDMKREENDSLEVVSLFSGAGGFDVGLEQAGFKTLACIDFDKDCRETIEFNRPDWIVVDGKSYRAQADLPDRILGDIRAIEPIEVLRAVKRKPGDIDLVVGGAPCQPFSNMGKKHGQNDEKNGDLFLHFVRFVEEIQPKAFIFENVVGITQGRHREVISYMKEQFSGMDFGISHAVLNAANYGVPQRRERFFLIGIRNVDAPAFPLPTHYKSEASWKTFVGGFDKIPIVSPQAWQTVGDTFKKMSSERRKRDDYACMTVSDKVVERMLYIKAGENFKVVPPELLPQCWKSGKHLGSDTFGRLDPDQPSVTIRTAAYNPSKGRYIHPFENRGLDTIEMAALQDFPPEWKFRCKGRSKVTLVSAGKQIGNAVPPSLAKALGKAVRAQLSSISS